MYLSSNNILLLDFILVLKTTTCFTKEICCNIIANNFLSFLNYLKTKKTTHLNIYYICTEFLIRNVAA